MEKTITIDDKQVKFKATAMTPRMYRQQFQADLFVDIQNLNDAWQKARANKEPLPGDALVMFENIAFTMAKQADPEAVPETADEWLEQFEMFSIWQILPEIIQLWGINNLSINESKKKSRQTKRELTTALFLLRCVQVGISLHDLDLLDVGMVLDIFAERSNDDLEWPVIATQEDIDNF